MNVLWTYSTELRWAEPVCMSYPWEIDILLGWLCCDRAARVFAPCALDLAGQHDLAYQLRMCEPVGGRASSAAIRAVIGCTRGNVVGALRHAGRANNTKRCLKEKAVAAAQAGTVWPEGALQLLHDMIRIATVRRCNLCRTPVEPDVPCFGCGTVFHDEPTDLVDGAGLCGV